MLSGHGFARNIRATSSGSWQAGISQLRTQQAAAVAAVVRSPFARGARFSSPIQAYNIGLALRRSYRPSTS